MAFSASRFAKIAPGLAVAGCAAALLAGCYEEPAGQAGAEGAPAAGEAEAAAGAGIAEAGAAPGAETGPAAGAEQDRAFAEIDWERLMAADQEPENWLTTGRTFGKTHYSPLDQIDRDSVSELGFAWDYQMGTTRGQESNPIVVDGVMYTSGTTGRAYALDAVTGEEIWAFDPMSDGQVNRYTCCDEVNRGVAVFDGMVYVASLDGRLFGLDAATGEVVWEQDTLDYDKDRAYTSSGAPEVAGDAVVIGNAGADYDARGYVSAYHRETGEFLWRFFVVPRDPDLGPQEHSELEEIALPTWDPDSRWEIGLGGTPWNGLAYDPELNLLYVGTGNAALFNWHERSPAGGDNLFLCSILAINPDTGELVWYYQETPRESWDYTAVQPMILADIEWEGEERQVLMQAPKNGFFYILDRATGELLSADPFVDVNWADGVDLETGRPRINTDLVDYQDGPKYVEPSAMGGHNWHPMAYSRDTGLVYIPAIEAGFIIGDLTDGHEYRPKQPNAGHNVMFGDQMLADPDNVPGPMGDALRSANEQGAQPPGATLKAFDPQTGEEVWRYDSVGWYDRAGVLATGGGLVFQGADTGHLRAFDDQTGELLWEVEVGTSIMAAPMTYAVDGVQYVAVQAGWGGGGWFAPHPTSAAVTYGNANRLIVFRLGGGETPLPEPLPEIANDIPEPPVQTADAETIARGARAFGSCALCHANQPDGLTPDLRRSALLHSPEGFEAVVLEGALRPQGMPQFDDVLDAEQTQAIRHYLIDQAHQAYEAQQAGEELETETIPSPTGH